MISFPHHLLWPLRPYPSQDTRSKQAEQHFPCKEVSTGVQATPGLSAAFAPWGLFGSVGRSGCCSSRGGLLASGGQRPDVMLGVFRVRAAPGTACSGPCREEHGWESFL